MPDANEMSGDLYVNYLPVPARDRRFLRFVVPGALWMMCVASFLWARAQHSPGTGVGDDATPAKLSGTLVTSPYPMLFTDVPGGEREVVLLVEMGKHGARQPGALSGQRVTVSGWQLHRDGRRMMELEPGEDAIMPDGSAAGAPPPPPVSFSPITLRGEIVDSKCYYGAMKPGEGKTHKECATLCIRGGIPPMLVTRAADGTLLYILLTNPTGGPLDPAAHYLIGEFVELSGEWADWSGQRVLRVRAENIRRLE